MKFSNTPYSLCKYFDDGRMDVKSYIEYCAKLGFNAVDLGYYWKNEAEELKQAPQWLKESKIVLGNYIVGNEFTKKDEKERRAEIEKTKHFIDCAAQIGAPAMRTFCGYIREGFPSYEESKKIIVECFQEACDHAQKKKVVLALENHGDICGKADQILDLIKTVGSKNLKACVDIGNFMPLKQDPVESIKKLMPFAVMTHIKDNKRDGDKVIRCVIGEGDVNLKACLQAIKDSGFKGYNTIEYEGVTEPDQKVGFERSWKNIQQTVKEIGG